MRDLARLDTDARRSGIYLDFHAAPPAVADSSATPYGTAGLPFAACSKRAGSGRPAVSQACLRRGTASSRERV
ncbi:hypothetical protein Aros01_09196 [Streptosporangium roseum]|uniref:Uncharacterized protein n=1 Tax=Streptosporangium roseum (strain ATCC 12428 / DSM 43021 / JCM 3005 / KCTC 9067 / NCIMB 10171 / NRRL 2505 / NI 9100) TaxID=479432 RepID=D2ARB4_STRRD|nr:hypothetical protein Sros_5707 [Streptosporangium roseum DSM 43021]